jgi:hypothetical protein
MTHVPITKKTGRQALACEIFNILASSLKKFVFFKDNPICSQEPTELQGVFIDGKTSLFLNHFMACFVKREINKRCTLD